MDISNRIQDIIRKNQLNAAKFADRIGVQRSNLSHVLTGRNKPGLDFIEKVLNEFPEIDANWLISGVESRSNQNLKSDTTSFGQLDFQSDALEEPSSSKQGLKRNSESLQTQQTKVDKIIIFYTDGTFEELKK